MLPFKNEFGPLRSLNDIPRVLKEPIHVVLRMLLEGLEASGVREGEPETLTGGGDRAGQADW